MTASTKQDVSQKTQLLERQEAGGRREVAIDDLLQGGREIAIRHASEVYVLRLTRQNKLLLTK
ncbi:MAG: hemin uptake protein HemP [Pseudomonadota bacterium]